jgi:hypothetical protein
VSGLSPIRYQPNYPKRYYGIGCGYISSLAITLEFKKAAYSVLRSVLVVCVVMISMTEVSVGNELSPRQSEIIRTVLGVEGFITKDLHEEFWSTLPSTVRKNTKERRDFLRSMDSLIAVGVLFQRESWASIKASLEARQVSKSPGYAEAKEKALYGVTNPGFRKQAKKGVANAEAMIRAAASGKPFQTPNGPMFITDEMVDEVLAGLDGSIARFKRLANPKWRQTAALHRYPDAHVSIISETPFTSESKLLTAENGKEVEVTILTNRLNKTDLVFVTFSNLNATWAYPTKAVTRVARRALQNAGVSPSNVYSSEWRNNLSASGNGKGKTADGYIYVSTRVVEMRELGGFITFIAVTESSNVDADTLRLNLERSSQLLD